MSKKYLIHDQNELHNEAAQNRKIRKMSRVCTKSGKNSKMSWVIRLHRERKKLARLAPEADKLQSIAEICPLRELSLLKAEVED